MIVYPTPDRSSSRRSGMAEKPNPTTRTSVSFIDRPISKEERAGRFHTQMSGSQGSRRRSESPGVVLARAAGRVQRPGAWTGDQEERAAHELRIFRADLVQDGPYAELGRDGRRRKRQRAEEEPWLGREHGHE